MDKTINVSVQNKIAMADGTVYICGNSDYMVEFEFDREWDSFEVKTARFIYGSGHTDVLFSGNSCPVPVIKNTHSFKIGVFAGNLHTTTAAQVFAKKSILCESGSPVAPAADVYSQIMEKLNSLDVTSPEAIAAAVEEYMDENPADTITIEEINKIINGDES